MKLLYTISTVLLVVGGLNWGLIGLFDFNLVSTIFGNGVVARVIYTAVGLAALPVAADLFTRDRLTVDGSRNEFSRRAA